MLPFVGVFLILIGLISLMFSIAYGYKQFKKDDSDTITGHFFETLFNLLDIFSALDGPKSFVSFVFFLSIGAIIVGFILIRGLFH